MRNLFIVSATLNIVLIATLILIGTQRTTFFEQIIAARAERLASQFELLPKTDIDIVMLGDSLTEGGHWQELFPNIKVVNRGIGGDTSRDLIKRVNQVFAIRPQKIFIMIGINDLNKKVDTHVTLKNYSELFDLIDKNLPNTDIFLQSVLPVNSDWAYAENKDITTLNIALKEHAELRGYRYLDLNSNFAEIDGHLKRSLSNDGIHLLGNGYQIWRDSIKEHAVN